MKKCIKVIGVLCLGISLIGCSTSLAASYATVELEGNPSTGYGWEYEIVNPDIIEKKTEEYMTSAQDDDIVGAGGIFIFTFEGLREGEKEIIFRYQRPWEEDVLPEETITYLAVVDSNQVVTLTQK